MTTWLTLPLLQMLKLTAAVELTGIFGDLQEQMKKLGKDLRERYRNPLRKEYAVPVFSARRSLHLLRKTLWDSRKDAFITLGMQPQEAEQLLALEKLEEVWEYQWFRNEDKVTPPEPEASDLSMLREKLKMALREQQ